MSSPGKVCAVLYCNQRGITKNISYHKVPKNKAMRQFWLKRIRRRDYIYNPREHIFVCSKHFENSDFKIGLKSNHRYLKSGAVPSIFDWDFGSNISNKSDLTESIPQECGDLLAIVKNTLSDIIDVVDSTNSAIQFDEFQNNVIQVDELENNAIQDFSENDITSMKGITHDLGHTLHPCFCSRKLKELEALVEELKLKLRKAEKELKASIRNQEIAEKRLKASKPSIEKIKDSNKDILFYTGLPTYEL